MGVITDYFRAADTDTVVAAMRTTEGLPLIIGDRSVFDGVTAKGIDPDVVLGELIAAIRGVPWSLDRDDIDNSMIWPTTPPPGPKGGADESWTTGPWVSRLPETTRDLLADTDDTDLPTVAARWVESEELEGATAEDMLGLLQELVGLARRARDGDESLFCWICV